MRTSRSIGVALVAFGLACAEPDTPYGLPSGIIGRRLPSEPVDAFGSPYDARANRPTTTLQKAHAGTKPGPAASDTLACRDCHLEGGAAPSFSFGGRVVANGAPVPDVDVLVSSEGATLGPVKSDADGFFWRAGPALPDRATAAVRKGDAVSRMGGTLPAASGGSCDGAACHVPGGQGTIHP